MILSFISKALGRYYWEPRYKELISNSNADAQNNEREKQAYLEMYNSLLDVTRTQRIAMEAQRDDLEHQIRVLKLDCNAQSCEKLKEIIGNYKKAVNKKASSIKKLKEKIKNLEAQLNSSKHEVNTLEREAYRNEIVK